MTEHRSGHTVPRSCLAILLVSSLFELWAAASLCHSSFSCQNELAWAVACGAISLFICLCMTVMASCDSTKSVASQLQTFVAVLLFLLWAAGAGICTFKGPFNTACGSSANGYFACWISFIASCLYLFATVPAVEHCAHESLESHGTYLGGVLVTSLVVTAQAAYDGDSGRFTGMRIWAVTAGAVSVVLVMLLMLVSALQQRMKYVVAVLAGLWIAAVVTLTFTYKGDPEFGIFAAAGNGFFACWCALFISFTLCYTTWVPASATHQHEEPILRP